MEMVRKVVGKNLIPLFFISNGFFFITIVIFFHTLQEITSSAIHKVPQQRPIPLQMESLSMASKKILIARQVEAHILKDKKDRLKKIQAALAH